MDVAVESQTYVVVRVANGLCNGSPTALSDCLARELRSEIATITWSLNMHGMPVWCVRYVQRWVTCRPMPEKPLAKLTIAIAVTDQGKNISLSLQALCSSILTCYMNMPNVFSTCDGVGFGTCSQIAKQVSNADCQAEP